jgi:hypothetical protein
LVVDWGLLILDSCVSGALDPFSRSARANGQLESNQSTIKNPQSTTNQYSKSPIQQLLTVFACGTVIPGVEQIDPQIA